jgi:hypothetical protein
MSPKSLPRWLPGGCANSVDPRNRAICGAIEFTHPTGLNPAPISDPRTFVTMTVAATDPWSVTRLSQVNSSLTVSADDAATTATV